jgi:outer membrane protein insertion porin family
MPRVLARFVVLFALALAFLLVPTRAGAQRAAGPDEVTVLAPPPMPPSPPAVAEVQKASPDLTRFLGQTIATVDVVVEDNQSPQRATWGDVHPPIISMLRAGDKLTSFSVRRAMEEAMASGHSADAWVTVVQEPSGVHVTVHVMPRKIIDSIRVDLHGTPLDDGELLRDAELATENELVARDISALQARLDALLQRRGFPAPQVNISTRPTDDPLRVVLMLDISPGAPRKIERRVLYPVRGTKEEIEDAKKFYPVLEGARADEPVLAAADAALEGRIRARGRHRAEVNHDVVLHRGLVVLRVRIDYGTRYETRYEGNDHFDKSTLDGVLDLEDETDRTPNHLVQKVREYYVKHGFLDAEVKLEPRGEPATDEISYLVFHVTEGQRVYVAARSYPCLREDDVRKLSEGGPTSARAIGSEIDSYLEEELPGNDLIVPPRSSGLDATIGPSMGQKGARPTPLELDPHSAYVPETYERAVQHVQELYRAEGFLSAQVGPVQVIRRRCDPRGPAGECKPMAVPEAQDICTYDASGLPLPVASLEQGSTCVPDPAHGITCEPRVWLRIPIKLGPRTQLWDVAFGGSNAFSPQALGKIADVKLGQYVNSLKIDEARRRVADAYKEEGYAFVDVKYLLEQSPDHTRARVRFIVSEGEKVYVRQIVVRGNVFTKTHVIERRIALEVNGPYRASLVRKTEERIATLGTFASVGVALENPYVPQKNKTVIITVVERPRQYSEVAPGFSTGEGFRVRAEYGHNNLWGTAVGLTLRLQLAYIPTPLIIDPVARDNYRDLNLLARIGLRLTGSLVFPEIGLGPLVRTGVDGILVHDLQRDFYITKIALIPNANYRPISEIQFSLFNSFEFNNSRIFQEGNIPAYLESLARQGRNITDLVRQLLVPDGESYVISQRFLFTWDRRDNAFNASKGTYFVSGVEHVDGYPIQTDTAPGQRVQPFKESHFFKFTQTFGGYIPLPKGLRIAALTRIGSNVQITSDSTTYPDRLFFMGGVDSMRGWNLNSFIPQDDVDRIFATQNLPDDIADPGDATKTIPNPDKYTPASRPIRGGNLMMNERIELRIPIRGPFETVIFGDLGNLWIDPEYPFRRGKFPIRAAVGSGIRVQTPVGPLAVDYGINITKQPYEDFGAINFAIGLF